MVLGPGHCTMVLPLYFRKLFLQLLPYFLIVLTFSFQIFHNLISACYIFCSFVCLIVFIHPSILQTAYPLQGHRRAAQHFGPMAGETPWTDGQSITGLTQTHIHTHNHTYRLVTRAGTTLSSLSPFSYFPSLIPHSGFH